MENVLIAKTRNEFRAWLIENCQTKKECWIEVKRGKPLNDTTFWYIDAVEEALCFGWIDSTTKELNGRRVQRFSPRKKTSLWTELNKERVKRLEKLGLMTDAGRKVFPVNIEDDFKLDKDIETALKQAEVLDQFKKFPLLYQRIRAYNVAFYKKRDPDAYKKALDRLIHETKRGKMFGDWNDYGRLLDY